jgi:hypothetical protein
VIKIPLPLPRIIFGDTMGTMAKKSLYLNSAQIKGLSGLFFNLSAGTILGGFGFVIAGPLAGKLFI